MTLLPVADAQARVLALAAPRPSERVPLAQAVGRYATEDVIARRTQPAAALSAMDGYAIRFADLPGPWRVTGEITPGAMPAETLAAGEAMRIFTGAPLPAGADTILVQEDATRTGEALALSGEGPAKPGQHVRTAGGDFHAGDILIARGQPVTAARIGLAVLGGHAEIAVGRRPRIALISTGDELVPPGAPTEGVRLPASNAVMLGALLGPAGAIVEDRGIVPDDRDAIATAFDAARDADIIVTTGGASVGDHDLVMPVLQSLGATLDFWKIAMKPGKPLMAGTLGQAAFLGLPGNPVSAFVTATLFVLPLVRRLQGAADPLPPVQGGRAGHPLKPGGPRAEYLRAIWSGGGVVEAVDQDSAAMVSLASANALIVRAPNAPAVASGEFVDIVALT